MLVKIPPKSIWLILVKEELLANITENLANVRESENTSQLLECPHH